MIVRVSGVVSWVTGFQLFPVAPVQNTAFPFSLPTFSPSSTPLLRHPQRLCRGCRQLRPSSLLSFTPSVPAAQPCCPWSVGLCAAHPSPLLPVHLPAASWDASSWTKNLSWARKLWSSKSSERHLMIRCLIKAGMVPKPKREAHTAYLILCCREIWLLV